MALRALAGLVLLAAVLATACLFSTTPPERSDPTQPGGNDPHAAVLTGKVEFRDRTDRHASPATDHAVRITWFGTDRDQNGQLDIVQVDVVYSDRSANYVATSRHAGVRAAEVQARVCGLDLDGLECCVDQRPCPNCPPLWTGAQRRDVQIGGRSQHNLQVWCDHAP